MFLAVVVGKLLAFLAEVLLHERVHNDLFANSMACDLPTQLVSPSILRLDITAFMGAFVLIVIFVHLLPV